MRRNKKSEFDLSDEDEQLLSILHVILDLMYLLICIVIVLVGAYLLVSDIQQYNIEHGIRPIVFVVDEEDTK